MCVCVYLFTEHVTLWYKAEVLLDMLIVFFSCMNLYIYMLNISEKAYVDLRLDSIDNDAWWQYDDDDDLVVPLSLSMLS